MMLALDFLDNLFEPDDTPQFQSRTPDGVRDGPAALAISHMNPPRHSSWHGKERCVKLPF
jgi:hypothetical protein